jgi:hypothetical protein
MGGWTRIHAENAEVLFGEGGSENHRDTESAEKCIYTCRWKTTMNKELIGVYCIDIKFLNSSSVRLNFFYWKNFLIQDRQSPGVPMMKGVWSDNPSAFRKWFLSRVTR